jgi:quercetin dioxygenase-like cupin family protein
MKMSREGARVRSFPAVDVGHGVTRRVLADSPELMLVEFAFADGAEGLPHSHPHVQSTFVKAGRFRFALGDESFEVGPGDAFVVPSGVVHGCRLIEGPGVLLDSFTPRREDFL